jgi:hypothetical protein
MKMSMICHRTFLQRYTFFLLLMLLLCSRLHTTDFSLRLTLLYDSNPFNLSDSERDSFLDGRAFHYIETSDDLIQRLSLRVSDTFTVKSTDFTPFINPSFTNFAQNSDKNAFSLLTGVNTRYQKFSANLSYGYYPQNYVRRYIDSDGTGDREKFDYQKMMWRMSASYRYSPHIIPLFYLKYEYYHHNRYFIEYDAPAWTTGLGWRFSTRLGTAEMMYKYRTYTPSSDHSHIQYIIDNVKDGAYHSNIYELTFRTKRYYHTLSDYRLYASLALDDRYYQSTIPLVVDQFHTGRNDLTTTIKIGSDIWMSKHFNLNVDLLYRYRKVTSGHQPVIRAKEYDKFQISTTVEYRFSLK